MHLSSPLWALTYPDGEALRPQLMACSCYVQLWQSWSSEGRCKAKQGQLLLPPPIPHCPWVMSLHDQQPSQVCPLPSSPAFSWGDVHYHGLCLPKSIGGNPNPNCGCTWGLPLPEPSWTCSPASGVQPLWPPGLCTQSGFPFSPWSFSPSAWTLFSWRSSFQTGETSPRDPNSHLVFSSS